MTHCCICCPACCIDVGLMKVQVICCHLIEVYIIYLQETDVYSPLQLIQLKSQFDILPGSFQSLNIQVEKEHLAIHGKMPPKLVSIDSQNDDGIYGEGDLVVLTLEFATDVNVSGIPSLTLNTGCSSEDCVIKEIQSFRCAADFGSFAMKLEDQFVMSIPSNTTQDEFKYKLETFEGVNEVTVHYSEIISGNTLRNEICTSGGNTVTITFEDISFPQYDGDLPTLEFDSYNWFNDPRTQLPQGNVDERLKGIHQDYIVELNDTSLEIQKGKNQRNSEAYYVSGAGSNVLVFHYNVRVGDDSPALDVLSINFDNGYIYSPITGANVSTSVPPLGKSYRYMNSAPSSLSYNRDMTITSSVPRVVAVTSPNDNKIYTRGDSVLIYVQFDIPIKYYGNNIYLLLKPGTLFRQAFVQGLTADMTTMIFQYDVSAGDVSEDLDYRGIDSVILNGGFIYRFSEGNLSVADLTLPIPGDFGSLSASKDIIIDTNSPLVLDFELLSPVDAYTAGDEIDILVRFDFPVLVIGTPIIWVRNEVRQLNNAQIRYAPLGQYSRYEEALPGSVSTITLEFTFNWELHKHDDIVVVLPSFSGADNDNVALRKVGSWELFIGKWEESIEQLTLTLQNDTLAPYTKVLLEIEAGSSIAINPDGIVSSSTDLYYFVTSDLFNTTNLFFMEVEDIMFSSLNLDIFPAITAAEVGITLRFSIPKALVEGDTISLQMPGFILSEGANDSAVSSDFSFFWNSNSSILELEVISNPSMLLFDVALDSYIPLVSPQQGVNRQSVSISAEFANSGRVQDSLFPVITHICSDPLPTVVYMTNHPGWSSAVEFKFTAGLDGILTGDEIVFSLPWSTNPGQRVSGDITEYLIGPQAALWSVVIVNDILTFTAQGGQDAGASNTFMIDVEAGLVVPFYGVRVNNQTFTVQMFSGQCLMSEPMTYFFTEWVLDVAATASFTSTVITNRPVGIDIDFYLADDLVTGDVVFITMPDFFRPENANPYDNITDSTVPVVARYNRFFKRMEFTLGADFISSGDIPFHIAIPESPGFHLPDQGLMLNDDSMLLSIQSVNGNIVNTSVDNPCIGFCTIEADYSVVVSHEPVTLEFSTYFSEILSSNEEIVLAFDGMSKDEDSTLGVTITPTSRSGNVAGVSWDANLNAIIVTIPTFNAFTFPYAPLSTVPKNELIHFSVVGLEFVSTSGKGVISRSGSAAHVNGTVSAVIPFPTVYAGPDISQSYMSFDLSTDIAIDPTESANMTVGFHLQKDLINGSVITIKLPSFDFNHTTIKNLVNILENQFTYVIDSGNKIIKLVLFDTVSASQTIEFSFGDIVLPYIGVDDNSTVVQYAVGFNEVMADAVSFTEVKGVKVVRDANVLVTSYDNPNLVVSDAIVVNWWSNFDISPGTAFTLRIPGLISAAETPVLSTSANVVVKFYTSNLTFHFAATSTISAGTVSIDVLANSSGEMLQFDRAGIQRGQSGYLIIQQFLLHQNVFPAATVSLPCIGICDALLSADVGKSSFSTAYTLEISFSDTLSYLDEITLHLEGFSKDSEEEFLIPHDDIDLISSWNASTSSLAIVVGNYTNSEVTITSLSLDLSRDILLRLPPVGVSGSDNLFNMSWASSVLNEVVSGSLLVVKPVSNLISSSLIISPRLAGVEGELQLTLAFSNELTPGDIIDISFPDYGFSDGAISLTGLDMESFTAEGLSANVISGIATLLLTCTSSIPAESLISVSFGGVVLPSDGVHDGSIRSVVSVVSDAKAAMSSQSILNYTRIGALQDSYVNVVNNRSSDVLVILMGFDVKCAIEIGGILEVFLPSVEGSDHAVVAKYGECLDCITALWQSTSSTLRITINYNMTTGINSFTLSSSELRIGSSIYYPLNVANEFLYSVDSIFCPISQTAFDDSDPVGMHSTHIEFGNPRAGELSSINVELVPIDYMMWGDSFVIILPGFSVGNDTPIHLEINGPNVIGNVTWEYDNSQLIPLLEITLPILANVASMDVINVEITSSNQLFLPDVGVSLESSNISLTRNFADMAQNITGEFLTLNPVGHFLTKGLTVAMNIPASVVPIELSFTLSGVIAVDESVTYHTPGFIKSSGDIWLSGTHSSYFSVAWDETTYKMTLTAVNEIPAYSLVTVTVNNMQTPANGISVQEAELFTVSTSSSAAPVVDEKLFIVSKIPAPMKSSIGFMAAVSSLLERVADPTIGNNSILLVPGHELNDEDIGTTVTIESTLYTIKDVDIDVITFEEEYTNTLVAQSYPVIHLHTPDARAAYFLNGSLSTELLFRYPVKRGDFSSGLDIHNTTSSIHISQPFQLLGNDQVLRVSQNPLVPFSQNLPSFEGGAEVTVDSQRPTVIKIDSSSPDGTYVAGQVIDFRVTFSYAVEVNLLPGQSPALLLRKANGDVAIARYYSGTDTEQLSFSYTIEANDFEYLNEELISVGKSYSLVQPLRVIMSNKFQYIRRSAKFPVIDTYPGIPVGAINVSSNISWIGDGMYVTNVEAFPSENRDDFIYSAGDVVFVEITFSGKVVVKIGDANLNPQHQLKVMLNVGKESGEPGHATFVNVTDPYTLLFSYTISTEDSLSSDNSSLLLACTCNDLYQRTFIELYNGTTIVEDTSRGHLVSTLLAPNEDPSSLEVLSPFYIENSRPAVVSVSSNVTTGTYSPGAAIVISVLFDRRVSSMGTTRLFLVGDNGGDCVAHFFSGNKSVSLQYLYLPSSSSRTSAMSCRYVESLDTTYGSVLRYSESPVTAAMLDFPLPGSGASVGIKTKVSIDGTVLSLQTMRVRSSLDRSNDHTTLVPLSDLYLRTTSEEFFHMVYLYEQEPAPAIVEFDTPGDKVKATANMLLENPLQISNMNSYSSLYRSFLLRDGAMLPFFYAPEIATTDIDDSIFFSEKHWWSKYEVSNTLEMSMQFDRRVVGRDLYLPLNVGTSLNHAKVGKETREWLLSIDLRNLSPDEKDINQHQFQMRYGGWTSSCISVGGALDGVMSFQAKLEEIPALRRLGFTVKRQISDSDFHVFLVASKRPASHELELAGAFTSCLYPLEASRLRIRGSGSLIMQYDIHSFGSIILQPNSTVQPGTYDFKVKTSSGLHVSSYGMEGQELVFEHFDDMGSTISKRAVDILHIPRVSYSALQLSADVPDSPTIVRIALSFDMALEVNDIISILLPGITSKDTSVLSGILDCCSVRWENENSTLKFTLLTVYDAYTSIDLSLNADFGLFLPMNGLFDRNSFQFSAVGQHGKIPPSVFQAIDGTSISHVGVYTKTPIPRYFSDIQIVFKTEVYIEAEANIIFTLPDYRIADDRWEDHSDEISRQVALGVDQVILNISQETPLFLSGPFSHAFTGAFLNSSQLALRPVYPLEPGAYDVTILESSKIIVGTPRTFPDDEPPSVSIEGYEWNMTETAIRDFTYVIGLEDSRISLEVDRPSEVLTNFSFSFQVSYDIIGPLEVELIIPVLTNTRRQESWVLNDNTTLTWNEFSKSFIYTSGYGVGNSTGFLLSLSDPDLKNFRVSRGGSKLVDEYHGAYLTSSEQSVTFSVWSPAAYMPMMPIHFITTLPSVLTSSLVFSTDIFSESPAEITIALQLSMKASLGDSFYIKLYEIPANTINNSVPIQGRSGSFSSFEYFNSNHTLKITIENRTGCCEYDNDTYYHWIIPADAGLYRSAGVIQTDSSLYSVYWENDYADTGEVFFQDYPISPFLMTDIAFDLPYVDTVSSISIKFITTTGLNIGDVIVFVLPAYSFPFGDEEGSVVTDVDGNDWSVVWNDNSDSLLFIVPKVYPQMSFEFIFSDELAPKLPSLQDIESSSPEVYVSRGDVNLVSQAVTRVQSICGVDANSSLIVFNIPDGNYVEISVSLSLGSAIDVGDVIFLKLSNFELEYDSVVDVYDIADPNTYILDSRSKNYKANAYKDSNSLLIEVLTVDNSRRNISLVLRSSQEVLRMSEVECLQNKNGSLCPVSIAVTSHSCPVPSTLIESHYVKLFEYSSIRLSDGGIGVTPLHPATAMPSYQNMDSPQEGDPTGAPTASPTSIPTGIPTASPTIFAQNVTFTFVNLELLSQVILMKDTVLSVHIPQISSSLTGYENITIYDAETKYELDDDFTASWNNHRRVLDILLLRDVSPGNIKLIVQSPVLILHKVILYENDASLWYQVSYISQITKELPFDYVSPIGLLSSTLSLHETVAGGIAPISILIAPAEAFHMNSTVVVSLPGFSGPVPGSVSFDNRNSTTCPNIGDVLWDSTASTITFQFHHIAVNLQALYCNTLDIYISESNGLHSSKLGVNNITSLPSITVNDINLLTQLGPTPFELFEPIVGIHDINISFVGNDTVVSGKEVPLRTSFAVAHPIAQGDVIDVFLPQFWSTIVHLEISSCLNMSEKHSVFSGEWLSCGDTLRLVADYPSESLSHCVSVSGLRIPRFGISLEDVDNMSISAKLLGGLVPLTRINSMQLVGHLFSSSLSFSNSTLNSEVGLTLAFHISTPFYVGETVVFTLPDIEVDPAVTVVESVSNGISFPAFTAHWDSGSEELTLTVLQDIPATTPFELKLGKTGPGDGCRVPSWGLFARQASGFVISTSAVEGRLDSAPVHHVQSVGIIEADVRYNIFELASPVEIFVHFRFSDALKPGDEITVIAPCLTGESNETLSVIGGSGQNFFRPVALVSFNNITKEFTLTIVEEVAEESDVDLFVQSSNELFIVEEGTFNQTHYIHGNSSVIGPFTAKQIDHSPSNIIGINPNAEPELECDIVGNDSVQNCTLSVHFQLHTAIDETSILAFSHRNLKLRDEREFEIEGTVVEKFKSSWRPADNTVDVKATSQLQYVEGYLYADEDYDYYPVDNVKPDFAGTVSVLTDLPHVVDVYANSRDSLVCGDAIIIAVKFSENVMFDASIPDPISLFDVKMILNTEEYAMYIGGNGTNIFEFLYHVENPVNVTDLGPLGPNALEFGETDIFRVGQRTVLLDPTIPEPFGSLLRTKPSESYSISVDCNRIITVQDVRICPKPFLSTPQYIQPGDVLDICVIYERPVVVGGVDVPIFAFNASSLTGSFVNVSSIQWIHIKGGNDASYALVYEGKYTSCINWANVSGLFDELAAVKELASAFPLTIDTFPKNNGFSHRLLFDGVAPGVLAIAPLMCPREGGAHVQLPDDVLRTLTFRRTILHGDDFNEMRLSANDSLAIKVLDGSEVNVVTYTPGVTSPSNSVPLGINEDGSLVNNTANVIMFTSVSQIHRVYSNFSYVGRVGDVVHILVVFESPVVVYGAPYLEVEVSNAIRKCDLCDITEAQRTELYGYSSKEICFAYVVAQNDTAFPLTEYSLNSVVLNGAEILSKSLQPTLPVNTTLQSLDSTLSLSYSNITINAVDAPRLSKVITDVGPGEYGAGHEIMISLVFYSAVTLVPVNSSVNVNSGDGLNLVPGFIRLNTTADTFYWAEGKKQNIVAGQPMNYSHGSGTDTLTFLYVVKPGDYSKALGFQHPAEEACILLEGDYVFQDILGNTWDTISDCSFEDLLQYIVIDTSTPHVWRVTSDTPDGKYYPGNVIDISVLFTKPVVILPDERYDIHSIPQFELIVPHQKQEDLLASYVSGNGTDTIHFAYVIPPPQLEFFIHPRIFLDPAGTASLFQHLNGMEFRRHSTNPYTLANPFIPAEDVSYLRKEHAILMVFEVPHVVHISSLNSSGLYTSGDKILLDIYFSQPVMTFFPPVLRLDTGSTHRSAIYLSGNNSNHFYYEYIIQDGDMSTRLDYIDTRLPPYSTNLAASYALKTDIIPGASGRLTAEEEGGWERYNDIVLYPHEIFGGVFRQSDVSLVPAELSLPLPGNSGSLSDMSDIQVDTTPPNVTKIFTTIPDGSYGPGIEIPVIVRFNHEVDVTGSPKILFYISDEDKYAEFVGGSGSTELHFTYVVETSDEMELFDYKHRDSFIYPVTLNHTRVEQFEKLDGLVKRVSESPSILANTTLAWVTYVESVISSTSISGSGHRVRLAGTTDALPVDIAIENVDSRSYSVGDVLDLIVTFSNPVDFTDEGSFIVLNTNTPAFFVKQLDPLSALFRLTLQYGDKVESLTYPDVFSLRTSTPCSILKVSNGDDEFCAGQNLPAPRGSSTDEDRIDSLSSVGVVVKEKNAEPSDFSMEGLLLAEYQSTKTSAPPLAKNDVSLAHLFISSTSELSTGQMIQVHVSFTEAVVVEGSPLLVLYIDSYIPFQLRFVGYADSKTLIFEAVVSNIFQDQYLECSSHSEIILNGGGIFYQTNFVRVKAAHLALGTICCERQCNFQAQIHNAIPTVSRVYSSLSGTFFAPDEVEIFVEYTGDIFVIGSPVISLNLFGDKVATFKGMSNSYTLAFSYICDSDDSSAGLDYTSKDAFYFASDGYFDGVYMDNIHDSLLIDNTLPEVGEVGSLGRENTVIIDETRAANTDIVMTPYSSTAGEVMVISYSYNRDIVVEIDPLVTTPDVSSFYLSFDMTSNVHGTSESYRATYSHASERTIHFTFFVNKNHLSGPVSISSAFPIHTGDFRILDKQTGALAGLRMLSSLISMEIGNIDNDTPYVLEVISPNISQGIPWGIGDTIQIDVIMSSPVAIVEAPVLRLALAENQFTFAAFDPYLGDDTCYSSVRFKLNIEPGMAAYPLEYTSFDGFNPLTGDLRRCVEGADPTIIADLTLSFPFTKGSLGHCCPVNIDAAAPYIKYVMPLKRAGLYGFNEEIAIMVRFSKPVVVVGYPLLELDVGTGVAYANYTNTFYERELLIDILDTDVFFLYKIGLDDETSDLHHLGVNSVILNESSILLKSQNPVLSADVTLRDPLDHEMANGVIEQQWKFGYPSKVEVLLRDLYHTDPEQLTVRLEHGPKAVELFDQCCRNGAIGRTAPFSRLGNNATVLDIDTAIGTDLFFSDTRANNIALSGVVNQSSTAFGAFPTRAIDGGNSPFFGDQSVTETSSGDLEAWWQIYVQGSNVQSINIWPRTPQEWIPAVTSVTIKAWDKFPRGKFKLEFDGVLDENGLVNPVRTGFINMGATANDVRKRIHEHGSLRQLKVSRQTIYGDGEVKGHGHKYLITFIRVEIAEPQVSVVETTFIGGTDVIEGQDVDNIQSFQLSTSSMVEIRGQAKQVDRVANFVGGVDGLNSWLLPYWVMIFEETGNLPPIGLEESKEKAMWKREFTSIQKLEQIVFAEPLENVGYVKIQREGVGSLSLAEVEIYEHRLNTLFWYREGFPVAPTPVTKPFQPLDSFHNAFKDVKFDGQWSVQFSTTANHTKGNVRGWEGSVGTVSDWVLVVTDLAGITQTYYQDLRAEVTAMPKYGQLITTTTGTTSPYAEWRDAFELTEDGFIEVSPDKKRALGICNGVDTTGLNGVRSGYDTYRYCPNSYGVGHPLNNRLTGDYPIENQFLRNERALFYVPNRNYRGPDFFTYKIFEGPMIQKSSATNQNEVTVHVRKCRDQQSSRITNGIHTLCSCSASEDLIVADWTSCHSSIQSICVSNGVFFDSFFNLCLQCGDVTSDNIRDVPAGCRSEIIRTVSYLVASRRCDTDPYYTCDDEIVTERGKESYNYLSLSKYPWNSPFQPMRQYAGDIS